MGFARVGSNPTVVDNFLPNLLSLRFVLVAQWIAHQTSDLGVGGSSTPWDLYFFLPDTEHVRANGVSVTLKLPKL